MNQTDNVNVKHDKVADAIYIKFTNEAIGTTKDIDNERMVDYGFDTGMPVGVDLICVSTGVKIDGLPKADEVKKILDGLGISYK